MAGERLRDVGIDWDLAALYAGAGVHDLSPKPSASNPASADILLRDRPEINPGIIIANIKAKTGFRELPASRSLQIAQDLIGLKRHLPGGVVETYDDKLRREEQKGHKEAAAVGLARIGDKEVVLFAMHWDFMAGSLGVVAGEKFKQALELATKRKLPFVGIYSSSGIRQQENFAGLVQMQRMEYLLQRFKTITKQPSVSVLIGQVWGGISASVVPKSDISVALAGTNYGFAGPRVIAAYEGKPVPEGAQSAEANIINRNLDVLVKDEEELLTYLEKFLGNFEGSHAKLTANNIPKPEAIIENSNLNRSFTFGGGFSSALESEKPTDATGAVELIPESQPAAKQESLYEIYEKLRRDPQRVDTQFLLENVFSDSIRLYNGFAADGILRYPAIIAAIGKLGPQPFLVIGNQPSYQRFEGKIIKIPASPTPSDFKYMRRILRMGESLDLPVVFFTDTLGAKPTLESEEAGQSREISETILDGINYKHPVISIVTGVLGSGGGLATTPMVDYMGMLKKALACVAEPRSAASILYSTPSPTDKQVEDTLKSMSATAEDQLRLGLADEVISESADPYITAFNIRDSIIKAYLALAALSERKRASRRDDRMRNLRGLQVKK